MKHLLVSLAAVLLATSSPQPNDGHRVRYSAPSGPMSVTVSQDITVIRDEPIHASRTFSFDLLLGTESDAVTVTIEGASGSSTAHEMKQRLSTRALTGMSFPLSIGDDGRQLRPTEPLEAVEIGLGPVTRPGFSIAGLLADTLPILSDKNVDVGTTWKTEQSIQSLEGWAWATGVMTADHRVTEIEQRSGHTLVTVETDAKAVLGPIEGGAKCNGTLERSLHWVFDATDGKLESLSLEQKTDVATTVPQGEISVRQITKIELAPRT